ncbi:MAG: hypothetical protein ACOH2R_16780 [Pseudomonas sp.]
MDWHQIKEMHDSWNQSHFGLGGPAMLIIISTPSHPQKYLIETNPAITDLKQFLGSDYMLAALGYNPDDSEKP